MIPRALFFYFLYRALRRDNKAKVKKRPMIFLVVEGYLAVYLLRPDV